jgi:hypothetical protein
VILATPQKVFRGSSKGIRDLRPTGAVLGLPHNLTLKADAFEESEIFAKPSESRGSRRRKLRRIWQAKGERVRRTWIPTTAWLTPKGKCSKSK